MIDEDALARRFAESEKDWSYECTGKVPDTYRRLAAVAAEFFRKNR